MESKPWRLVGEGKDAYVSCPVPEGWSSEVVQNLQVAIPPEGYVRDPFSKGMVYIGVDKKNPEPDDFYWVRQGLPKDYDERLSEERQKQQEDPEYSDPVVESFRQGAWIRRLSGCWFANGKDGKATYITGLHYYYLEWCFIAAHGNKGYPAYRESDRQFFLFVEHAMKNPHCFGTLLLTKRRDGKTQKSVAFGLEAVTRSGFGNFGIQSKTAEDAAKVVFKDSAIRMFARLPDFFKPTHDDRRLMNINNALVFKPKQTDAETFKSGRYLGGWVEHRSSTETAFDGTKLLRYVGDEVFKTQVGIDVYERWNVVKFCLIVDGKVRGKAMLTSTVEEIEGSTDMYIKMYAESDQTKLDEIGRTKTGLFRFFLPADEARNRDRYGRCDKDKNRDEILLERKAYAGDTMSYNSLVRKEPLTVEEAFRFLSRDSIFDTIKISDQIDLVSWRQEELLERGNYIWKSYGKEVHWIPTERGRWLRVRDYPHPVTPLSEEDNSGYKTDFRLLGTTKYVCGIDPFSHSRVEGRQKSDAAFYVKHKSDPLNPVHSDMFILQYIYRTSEVEQFYEDVLITLFLYGCQGLIENNKIGMVGYFENERVQNYLMKIKGQKNYGIAATKRTTQAMCEMIEKYIYENINKVYFVELLKDWANFDIDDTQEFDAAMASGYTLLADSKILLRKQADKAIKIIDIGDLL